MTASMTGFSFKEKNINSANLIVELKTLNSRYYELNLKIADQFKSYEPKIREIISANISRGKVECKIFFKTTTNHTKLKLIDDEALKSLIVATEKIAKNLNNPAPINPLDVLQYLSNQTDGKSYKNLKKEVFITLNQSIAELLKDRKREGMKIRGIILKQIRIIEKLIKSIKKIVIKAIKQHQLKVIKKFKDALIDVDDSRLKQEFLFFIQKGDIAEEIDRLESHVMELKRMIKLDAPSGKKMDFLMQEFNREANTVGSKAISIDISKIAIELKVVIEQIREQIQNIE